MLNEWNISNIFVFQTPISSVCPLLTMHSESLLVDISNVRYTRSYGWSKFWRAAKRAGNSACLSGSSIWSVHIQSLHLYLQTECEYVYYLRSYWRLKIRWNSLSWFLFREQQMDMLVRIISVAPRKSAFFTCFPSKVANSDKCLQSTWLILFSFTSSGESFRVLRQHPGPWREILESREI